MLVYGKCECFVMQMLYVCVLCASCGRYQCCVLHDLQFVNANIQPYLQDVLKWTKDNDLLLNTDKMTCTLLTPDPAEYNKQLGLQIDNTTLPMTTHPCLWLCWVLGYGLC